VGGDELQFSKSFLVRIIRTEVMCGKLKPVGSVQGRAPRVLSGARVLSEETRAAAIRLQGRLSILRQAGVRIILLSQRPSSQNCSI
jgi:hypothetical protein